MRPPRLPRLLLACLVCCTGTLLAQQPQQSQQPQRRPPAVPLITHNPYFSIWSDYDKLTDGPTRHWTGSPQPLTSIVRVDGKPYRIMGGGRRDTTPAMPQTAVTVDATHTDYTFEGAGVQVILSFFTPAFPQDMTLLSRPVTYLTWTAKSVDGSPHTVDALLDVSPIVAVNTEMDAETWGRSETATSEVLNIGSRDQQVLGKRGDNLRIDWGYFHLAAPKDEHAALSENAHAMDRFIENGSLAGGGSAGSNDSAAGDDMEMPAAPRDGAPHLAAVLHLGSVSGSGSGVSQHVMVSYTEGFALEYLNQRLRPYWQRNGETVAAMLDEAAQQYTALDARGRQYDQQLNADLTKAGGATGGADYAYLGNLAYRQSLAACEVTADSNGTPLYFCKENFSNGCIGTVDVMYPQSPILLFFNPALMEAQVEPVLRYAGLPRWKFPFSPHDLGTWPLADGQVYGGGEQTEDDQMPVEESGDMIIMTDAIAQAEGNAHLAERYWATLSKWADYLRQAGLDPANQLSTDDFAGHLAHNANLSIKAIDAIGAYADLAKRLGHADVAKQYRTAAEGMAKQFMGMAADGNHTKLAFDKPGTWSQKYNLVWDTVLGLRLFPPSLRESEIKFYMAHQNAYGVPLDSRKDYTKLDWELWSFTMATPEQFGQLVAPLAKWADTTPGRAPLPDWYDTVTGEKEGFQARSVVGGLFIKALADEALAKKWQAMAKAR